MYAEAMDAGIEVKVEEYDGTYVCLFCGESVRGQPALKCSHTRAWNAAPSEVVDLTREVGGAAAVAALNGSSGKGKEPAWADAGPAGPHTMLLLYFKCLFSQEH